MEKKRSEDLSPSRYMHSLHSKITPSPTNIPITNTIPIDLELVQLVFVLVDMGGGGVAGHGVEVKKNLKLAAAVQVKVNLACCLPSELMLRLGHCCGPLPVKEKKSCQPQLASLKSSFPPGYPVLPPCSLASTS
jgi:hypothetical protein